MSGDDATSYAPKSPDLSAFLSATSPTQQPPAPPPFTLDNDPYQTQHLHHHHNHHNQNHNHHNHHHNNLYQTSPPGYDHTPTYAPPVKDEYTVYGAPPANVHDFSLRPHMGYLPPNSQHLGPEIYGQPAAFYPPAQAAQHFSQVHHPIVDTSNTIHMPSTSVKQEPYDEYAMPSRRSAGHMAEEPPSVVIEPSPVKTKFPTARIKRIMQADEEVGKVAQQTPIAVGKALELFMVQLVRKSADIAKDKGSKRVTASMLKQVVETDDQWDFLREIVGKVETEKESKLKAKAESESEDESFEPKKKGRGGRKKKAV